MIRSNLCDYPDSYIQVKATIKASFTAARDAPLNNNNKKVISKSFAPFTNYISEVNNAQEDDTEDIEIVKPMCDLIEYSDVYSKTGILQQYYRDEPALDNNNNIIDFIANKNNNILYKFKQQIT